MELLNWLFGKTETKMETKIAPDQAPPKTEHEIACDEVDRWMAGKHEYIEKLVREGAQPVDAHNQYNAELKRRGARVCRAADAGQRNRSVLQPAPGGEPGGFVKSQNPCCDKIDAGGPWQ